MLTHQLGNQGCGKTRAILATLFRHSAAIAVLLGLGSTGLAQETGLLRVRIDFPDCTPAHSGTRGVDLTVSARGQDALGWPVTLYPQGKIEKDKPRWTVFEVPIGTEVALSVFASPYPLVERVFRMDSNEKPKQVHIVLAEAEPLAPLGVKVELPSGPPSWSSEFKLNVHAPRTGHVIKFSTISDAKSGLHLPPGDYQVSVHGGFVALCWNGAPMPEWCAPARKNVTVKATGAKVAGQAGTWVTLKPERGARLQLNVVHPDPPATKKGMEPVDKGKFGEDVLVIGQQFAGEPEDIVRVRLVSLDGAAVHDLAWGWAELAYVLPWEHFPMGQDVYQVAPVPCGEYELILRGQGIEELRQKVTLGPEQVTRLTLKPRVVLQED